MNQILYQEFNEIYNDLSKHLQILRNKSILITGANGLLGSYLTYFLIYLNHMHNMNLNIYVTSTSLNKLKNRFKAETDKLHFIEIDLSKSVLFTQRFDYIIHAASPAHPMAFSSNPVGVMCTNLIGTISLLEHALKKNGRFLFISSGEIYGNNKGPRPFVETDSGIINTTNPRSCYPESKRAAETLCISYYVQYGVHTNIARLCFVYGPTITDESTRIDALFLRAVSEKSDIIMNSAGNQRRTWCYVADALSGILHILLHANAGEVYNVAYSKSIASIYEYAKTLAKIAGQKVYMPKDVSAIIGGDSILDGNKLVKIGWEPKYNLKTGLKHTFEIKKHI